MSLETLLEAARFVEQQEKTRERLASSSSSSSDHPLAVAPHSNHHNSNEPRGAKLKRERTEQDDLFCEEKMLIIDEGFRRRDRQRAFGRQGQSVAGDWRQLSRERRCDGKRRRRVERRLVGVAAAMPSPLVACTGR